MGNWLVGWAEELLLLYTTKGYAIFECGISKKGLLDTYVYEGRSYKYFYIYVTVLWALFAYNGFANYRHMCITVWQVRVGLALVVYEDTYVYILIVQLLYIILN